MYRRLTLYHALWALFTVISTGLMGYGLLKIPCLSSILFFTLFFHSSILLHLLVLIWSLADGLKWSYLQYLDFEEAQSGKSNKDFLFTSFLANGSFAEDGPNLLNFGFQASFIVSLLFYVLIALVLP